MVTEKSSIEHEPQVQTPTNYHERIKFENTRAEKKKKKKKKFLSIRITAAITENHVNTQSENPVRTVLGTVS